MNLTEPGILFAKRHIRQIATVCIVSACLSPVCAAENKPVQMEKYVVNEKHMLCFGIAVTLWTNKNTGLVMAMYVKDVQPDSMAQQKGLRPGTRIWEIDKIPVENFEASFASDSELGKKFLNRQKNDKILLEVTILGERSTRTVVLQQSPLIVEVNTKTLVQPPARDWNWSPPEKPKGD